MPIVNRIADMHADITAWRRDLHAHPELLYDVHRTAAAVADKLKAFGCDEVVTGIGRTGVVGVIRGSTAGRGKADKVIGLRADMDALPIEEANDLPYKSTVPGKMHACGHDGHTAMLLGAARYLAETRNFAGTAVVIFQPAEEGGAGGKAMVQDGLMERFGIEEVYGMHNYPGLAGRRVRDPAGPDDGGRRPPHDRDRRPRRPRGAAAHRDRHRAGRRADHQPDPVDRVAQRRSAAGGRGLDLHVPGRLDRQRHPADRACCAAPRAASRPQVRDLLEQRLREVVEGTARLLRRQGQAHLQARLSGDPQPRARDARSRPRSPSQVVGSERVDANVAPVMGAEDFSFMLEARPGAFIFVGNGDSAGLHHPAYDFNDEVIPIGTSYWVKLVETALAG